MNKVPSPTPFGQKVIPVVLGEIRGVTIKASYFLDETGRPVITVYGETYQEVDGTVMFTDAGGGIGISVLPFINEKNRARIDGGLITGPDQLEKPTAPIVVCPFK